MPPLTYTRNRAPRLPRCTVRRSRELYMEFLESRQLLSSVSSDLPPTIGTIYFATQPTTAVTLGEAAFGSVYSDAFGGPLTSIDITALPAHGVLTLNGSPVGVNQSIAPSALSSLTYTPNAAFAGPDSFRWDASDGSLTSRPATAWLTVGDNPTADVDVAKSVTTLGGNWFLPQEWSAGFLDSAAGHYLQQVKIETLPTHGVLSLNAAPVSAGQAVSGGGIGLLYFKPAAGYTGPDSFQWTGSDGTNTAPTPSTFSLNVFTPAVSDLPAHDVAENFPLQLRGADFNDYLSSAGNPLSEIEITSRPAHGSLAYNGNPISIGQPLAVSGEAFLNALTYTPDNGYIGPDSFSWTGSDGTNGFAPTSANVTLNVLPLSGSNISLQTPPGVALSFSSQDFYGNLRAGTFNPLTQANSIDVQFQIVSLPAHGTLRTAANPSYGMPLNAGDWMPSSFYYIPDPGYTGTDSFGWSGIFQGAPFATPASVNITVVANQTVVGSNPPTLTDVSESTYVSGYLGISAFDFGSHFSGGFSGGSGSMQTVQIVSLPSHGTLTMNGNAVAAGQTIAVSTTPFAQQLILTYTPTPGYAGADSFQWNASDGTSFAASPANVAINVGYRTLLGTYGEPVTPNTAHTIPSSDFNSIVAPIGNSQMSLVEITALPAHGTLTVNGSPVVPNTAYTISSSTFTYTPESGFTGSDSLTWTGADGPNGFGPNSAWITFSVQVAATVSNFTETAAEGRATVLPLSDFQKAFSQGTSSLGSITFVTLPAHGTITIDGNTVTAGTAYTVSPFIIRGIGGFAAPSTGTDLSTVLNHFGATNPAWTSGNFSSSTTINGTDLSFFGYTPVITYTPDAGYMGADSFTWTGSTALNVTAATPATVSLNVVGMPTATDFSKNEIANVVGKFTLADFTSHFSDPNSAPLASITITNLPGRGTLKLNGVAVTVGQTVSATDIPNLTYTSSLGGSDSFLFTASDGTLSSNVAVASLLVAGPPVLVDAFTMLRPNGSLVVLLPNGTTSALTAVGLYGGGFAPPQAVKITALPTSGQILLNKKPLHVGQVITPAQFSILTYSAKSPTFDSFSVTMSDGFNYAAQSAVIRIAAPNPNAFYVTHQATRIASGQAPSLANGTDFGTWAVAPNPSLQADVRTFTLYNTTNKPISLAGAHFTGRNASDFSIFALADLPIVLPGQSFSLSVRFSPHAAGKRVASLVLPGPNGTKPLLIQLAGTGVPSRTVHTDAAGTGGVVQIGSTAAGKGGGATNGQIVSITYTGYLADGTVFDSSASHPTTAKTGFTFRLDDAYGQGQPFLNKDKASPVEQGLVDSNVIAGWEFGLQGIKVGEKRTLIMNAAAAYGTTGVSGIIPGGATLRFEVQCVAMQSKPQLAVSADTPNGTPAVLINPGQTATSTSGGTLFSGASASQRFSLLSVFSDNANGVPLANVTVSGITLSGPAAKDFSVVRTGNNFTVTFHPTAAGNRNATVHIHSKDPLHPDFTFAIRGQSGSTSLALVHAK